MLLPCPPLTGGNQRVQGAVLFKGFIRQCQEPCGFPPWNEREKAKGRQMICEFFCKSIIALIGLKTKFPYIFLFPVNDCFVIKWRGKVQHDSKRIKDEISNRTLYGNAALIPGSISKRVSPIRSKPFRTMNPLKPYTGFLWKRSRVKFTLQSHRKCTQLFKFWKVDICFLLRNHIHRYGHTLCKTYSRPDRDDTFLSLVKNGHTLAPVKCAE